MTQEAPPTCPRCGGLLRNEHGDGVCLVHGTIVFAPRAWDALEEPPPASKRPLAPNAGKRWTEEEKAFVLANKDARSSKAMAEALQRPEHAVNQLLYKAAERKERQRNARKSVPPPTRADTLAQLEDRARPGGMRRLAASMGMSYRAAYLRLYRRGIRVMHADGMMSEVEVARLYGCSRRRVRMLIRRGHLKAQRVDHRTRIAPEDAEEVARLLRGRSKFTPRRRRR